MNFSHAKLPITLLLVAGLLWNCNRQITRERVVLVFSKTEGYRHQSIEDGIAAISQLGKKNNFRVIATEDASRINEDQLKMLSAVIFLNTTGDVLDHYQQADLERFVQAGGGFVGIHSAADTEYNWIWYGRMVGGYFHSHPETQKARLTITEAAHASTAMLPESWTRTDEWYNYKKVQPGLHILMKLDESSYEGGNHSGDHPIAWYHEYDGGRAFYTGLGHTPESYSEDLFLQHILGGIEYAIGENRLDYKKATSKRIPEENRFVRTILADYLDEPMELDVLPDGRLLIVERKGRLKMYIPRQERVETITKLNVHIKFEDGLLGIAVDPDYHNNHWIYMIYSPAGDIPKQHVSRFVFKDDSLHYATEKVLLEIGTQRDECCHSGGSMEFDAQGNLYITTGDDTNPFASDGFAPVDERPGRSPWDAQKSSANTNDLRGKILRITPKADGTYRIPEGNLFPPGTPDTRPEIYVMGCRNPFRMSVDHKTGYVYWGDVGPDAGESRAERGPKGIDEINQARTAGFWGWPYTRGNNIPYHDYDFVTKQSGALFDPQKPINDSPNNTGMRELPPIRESMIWYSYDRSEEFPWVGKGGKNPMAGPVYYADMFTGKNKFPPYFEGKLFIYEWMRHWIYIVKMDGEGNFLRADPFMPNTEFSRPMDMVFDQKGALYVLEYGNTWFAQNSDARLSRIDYISGNRPPIASIEADKSVGAPPLSVQFSAANSLDYDGDPLTYEWKVNGKTSDSKTQTFSYTFETNGEQRVELVVRDPSGKRSAAGVTIRVGNDPPALDLALDGNQSFFWPGRRLAYQIKVSDREDGSSGEPGFDSSRVILSFDFMPEAYDIAEIAQGHLAAMQSSLLDPGALYIERSDCKNCHAIDKKINGPSYLEIAQKYKNDPGAREILAAKIIEGGAGNWGQTAMAAHPDLNKDQTGAIADYILSLATPKEKTESHPLAGVFQVQPESGAGIRGKFIISASYTDKGSGLIEPLTAQQMAVLQSLRLQAENANYRSDDVGIETENDMRMLSDVRNQDFFGFNQLDLTGISAITLGIFVKDPTGASAEIRLENERGPVIGKAELGSLNAGHQEKVIPIEEQNGKHHVFVVFRNQEYPGKVIGLPDWIEFQTKGDDPVLSLK